MVIPARSLHHQQWALSGELRQPVSATGLHVGVGNDISASGRPGNLDSGFTRRLRCIPGDPEVREIRSEAVTLVPGFVSLNIEGFASVWLGISVTRASWVGSQGAGVTNRSSSGIAKYPLGRRSRALIEAFSQTRPAARAKESIMQPRLYRLDNIGSGWLAIMGRPRAGDWVDEEFAGLSRLGVTDVVSLLEKGEARELGLAEEACFCERAGMRFHSFPIVDRGVPASAEALSVLGGQLHDGCSGGHRTVIHCRAGIGRSAMVATVVLMRGGVCVQDALAAISKCRGVSVPDTDEQLQWLIAHQSTLRRCHRVQ